MKCYFALSDDVAENDEYYYMFMATINSARKNTSLELHCLYDFRKTYVSDIKKDRIYNLLKESKVVIHNVSIDFEKELMEVYTDEYLKSINVTRSSLYSRFLRFMIADIETNDECILYADTDILFYKDIENINTKTIAVCPEFKKTNRYTYFNAGVMLINLNSYRKAKSNFIEMLRNKKHPSIECCDQGYLNDLYKNNFEKLDLKYNWKPYWGQNNEAIIIHLHGIKPCVKLSKFNYGFEEWISALLHDNKNSKNGFYFYFSEFVKYTNNPELMIPVITNLVTLIETQKPSYFSFINKCIRKIKKVLKI